MSAGTRPRSFTLWPLSRAQARISAVRLLRPRPRPRAPPARRPTPRAAAGADVLGHRGAQTSGIAVVQVDLVGDAVQGEVHGLGRGTAVEIVFENDRDLLRH